MPNLLLGLVMVFQLVGPDETGEYSYPVDLGSRFGDFADAPFSWESEYFTLSDPELLKRRIVYRQWQREAEEASKTRLHRQDECYHLAKQCETAVSILDQVGMARAPWASVTTRRDALRTLRNLLGVELYEKGWVP